MLGFSEGLKHELKETRVGVTVVSKLCYLYANVEYRQVL